MVFECETKLIAGDYFWVLDDSWCCRGVDLLASSFFFSFFFFPLFILDQLVGKRKRQIDWLVGAGLEP